MFRRILVGWDGSHGAAHAVRVALDLACELGGEVVALGIAHPPAHVETSEDRALAEVGAKEQLTDALAVAREQAARDGVPLSEAVAFADQPGDALVGYARAHAFDLVVIGRHGTSSAVHPGTGPIAEQVVRQSPCPVLVVGD
jgi:nucleotide-binding universal stress UspA family protein